MFTCSNTSCAAKYAENEADKVLGICSKCGAALANELKQGWAYVDSLRVQPLAPNSMQSKAAALGKVPPPAGPPIVQPPITRTIPPVLTAQEAAYAVKKNITQTQLMQMTPEQFAEFKSNALKGV